VRARKQWRVVSRFGTVTIVTGISLNVDTETGAVTVWRSAGVAAGFYWRPASIELVRELAEGEEP
jgi:hypothetical protein